MSIPREGLVAEYLFIGSARDSSGGGRDGVVHGATLTADRFAAPDRAYHFDGRDNYIEIAPPPPLNAGAVTVSVWARFARRDLTGWTSCIVAQDDGNDEDQSRRIFQLSAFFGRLVSHQMINARDPMWKRRVVFDEWTHLVAVADGAEHRLYADGVLCDQVVNSLRSSPDQPITIGRKGTPESYFCFRGDIDDLRIYDRALAESEVAALFHENGFEKRVPAPVLKERDPISGKWGKNSMMYLDLHDDGGGTITGQVMGGRPDNMAPIGRGTFDRSSGWLHLQGEGAHPRDGRRGPYHILGMLDGDELALSAWFEADAVNVILTKRGASWWRWRLHRLARRFGLVRAIDDE